KLVSFKIIIDVVALLLFVYFPWDNKLKSHSKGLSDLYTITIGSLFGLHLMVMAANLLPMYLAIEMVSIASYLLVAYRSENALSTEAGLKYVLFGAASSAILLYGISLLYGFTGDLSLFAGHFIDNFNKADSLVTSLALGLILVGIGFKLSFVPVHFWVPDAYQGAPTPVTAYLSTLPKIAAFALLLVFLDPLISAVKPPAFNFRLVLSAVGIITMIAGNFAAVSQNNVKRMLAYSSIGHTGFALMAVVTFSQQGLSSLIYYLAVYAIANVAALALASYFANVAGAENASDYKGLGLKYPVASVSFVVVLISLTGLPVTAGFTAKLFVFSSVYVVYQQTHDIWLLALMITGALTTVVALFYYIKIPLNLFLKRTKTTGDVPVSDYKLQIFCAIISIFLVLAGIFPDLLY
ncbi:MAG: NADH-quinone oxidoreductase subunit N, partial [Sphingobacteriales bacterium]